MRLVLHKTVASKHGGAHIPFSQIEQNMHREEELIYEKDVKSNKAKEEEKSKKVQSVLDKLLFSLTDEEKELFKELVGK